MPPICSLRNPNTGTLFHLKSCQVSVFIADVHASVLVGQTFQNPTSTALTAKYTFGIIAGAAVCGFEMIRADGTQIDGIVKDKEEAKKEYDQAVKSGHTAGLGAQETKDVFSISVGNINPSETITINLRYVQTLTDDEKRDQVRFYFPRTYAERYGVAPSLEAARAETIQQPFKMKVFIQQANAIKGVSCPSGHPMELELGRPSDVAIDPSIKDSQMAKVVLNDDTGYLTQDVILVINAAELDNPRFFIEPHPSIEHDTVALGLTFVPQFKIPDSARGMEYIFLVDRSGSMGDSRRMTLVREALVILLRALPTKNTTFNIVSFGSGATKLWDTSRGYSQQTLELATSHIDSMTANYGGTETASALNLVFSSLQTPLNHSVAVLLLTDGESWDVPTCVRNTEKACTLPSEHNFLRVFTLGIGDGVSTDLCDSIATAGNGISIYVAPNEPIVGKCARLVRAARTNPLQNLQIHWLGGDAKPVNDNEEEYDIVDQEPTSKETTAPSVPSTSPISLFDPKTADTSADDTGPPLDDTHIELPAPPKIQQSPLKLSKFFPGTRTQIYAIVSGKQTSIPSSIRITGTVSTTGGGIPVELIIPVTKLTQHDNDFPFIHTLAAKALITDRENGVHIFPETSLNKFSTPLPLLLEKEIVRLGITYGLASRHTSFAAVDRTNKIVVPETQADSPDEDGDDDDDESSDDDMGYSLFDGAVSRTLSSVDTHSEGDDEDVEVLRVSVAATESLDDELEEEEDEDMGFGLYDDDIPAPREPPSSIELVARLQQFDGSFKLTVPLLEIIIIQRSTTIDVAKGKCKELTIEEDVVATTLALEWLSRNGGDECLDLQVKAAEWLEDQLSAGAGDAEQLKDTILSVFPLNGTVL